MRKLAVVLLLAGCGGSADAPEPITSEQDSAVADTMMAAEDTMTPPVVEDTAAPSSYPSGPYGTAVGAVVTDLELVGYVRDATTGLATESTYGAAKLSDIRARATVKYAVIHVSGFT